MVTPGPAHLLFSLVLPGLTSYEPHLPKGTQGWVWTISPLCSQRPLGLSSPPPLQPDWAASVGVARMVTGEPGCPVLSGTEQDC